ncbi:DUF2793 domain-containing protein [Roseobacter sp. HKCCA0434]|uniref:DUF2793 domain-containing protein n=1 Tax=Roseobacter sp. HKCCA0434 TaxID=3079297 RepID=UPI00290597E4|nr:DUF2793 domain-containing protein [Roseobacter sp. HKCCA0434]
MTETTNLTLPMVQAAQAQKHVTVNAALSRLDMLVQLRLAGVAVETPPVTVAGVYAIGPAPTGDWAGQAGKVALGINGGWEFVVPQAGWLAWDMTGEVLRRFDGAAWQVHGAIESASGAGTIDEVVEFDVDVAGTTGTVLSAGVIPARSQVMGLSARVIVPLSGTGLTGWRLGADGSDNRYGSGLGVALNSYAMGLTGQPVTYWSDTPVEIAPEGAAGFDAGRVRIAVHLRRIVPPQAV